MVGHGLGGGHEVFALLMTESVGVAFWAFIESVEPRLPFCFIVCYVIRPLCVLRWLLLSQRWLPRLGKTDPRLWEGGGYRVSVIRLLSWCEHLVLSDIVLLSCCLMLDFPVAAPACRRCGFKE